MEGLTRITEAKWGCAKAGTQTFQRTWEWQHIRLSLEGQYIHAREVACQCGIMGEAMHKGRFSVLMDVCKGTCTRLQNSWMDGSTSTHSMV